MITNAHPRMSPLVGRPGPSDSPSHPHFPSHTSSAHSNTSGHTSTPLDGYARPQPTNPYLPPPPWLQAGTGMQYQSASILPALDRYERSAGPNEPIPSADLSDRPDASSLKHGRKRSLDNEGSDTKPTITHEPDSESAAGRWAKQSKADKKAGKTQDGRKSCAECRRLKAKCDRVFPCSNCRKRGCALVCPDGDLSCMQGKRLVLASTEQLHERISELEAALAQAHRRASSSSFHPLLSAQHLDGGVVKTSLSPPNPKPGEDRISPVQRSSSQTSMHTPRPASDAQRIHQGRMAVESLLIDEQNVGVEGKKEDTWVGENAAPAMIVGNAGTSTPQEIDDRQTMLDRFRSILRILPERETARRQADHFWGQSMWYQNILRREEFEAIYEPSVYAPTPSNPLTPHKLACVLMVLTLDTYLDIARSEDNPLVMEYWEGVQRCFDTRFGWGASIAGIQALALITLFVGFNYRGAGASTFYWLRQMTSAALQLGLHKDPQPSLPETEQIFRRRVFHELYSIDCLISVNHGQRTAIPLDSIEAKYPEDGKALGRLKYVYMANVNSEVIEIGCAADHVPKEQLEERVHRLFILLEQYGVEATPDPHCPILSGQFVQQAPRDRPIIDVPNMTRSTNSMCHFKALMFLFRPSLRRLIARLRTVHPAEPVLLTDTERRCVDQTFRASTSIIAVSGFIARHEPRLATRLWSTWVQTFSAAVSLTALAIWCGPYMPEGFIKRAYEAGIGGCEMIREHGCPRAQGVLAVLPILRKLIENRYPHLIGSARQTDPAMRPGEDMLFVLLGGHLAVDIEPRRLPEPKPPTVPSDNRVGRPQALQDNWQPLPHPIPNHARDTPAPHWLHTPMPTGLPFQASHPTIPLQPAAMHSMLPAGPGPDPFALDPAMHPTFQGMDTMEIWARLQTFYEPALPPPVWHAGMGGFGLDTAASDVAWSWTGEEFGVH